MNRCLAFVMLSFIFSSCSNKSHSDLEVFKRTAFGLLQSSVTVSSSSEQLYLALDDRRSNPSSAPYAAEWQPKAMRIKELSVGTINYIESLIKELKEQCGLKMENNREVFQEDNRDEVERLFIAKGKGTALQELLKKYTDDILAVDANLYKMFNKTIMNVADSNYKKGFSNTYFKDVPAVAAIAVLRSFESTVRITENQFITYCFNRTNVIIHTHDFITPIIALSSSHVKSGDEIKITAGIGMFSTIMQPVITINNKIMQPEWNGVITYSFKASGKAGKYIVPVKIEYTKPDGTKSFLTKNIEYTVAE
ncbi:hypothetical protein [Ferruginibacter sp. SUN106]|uniref:hypothetical protein n=1 Tax=Ferruginibacter sp. SUN106 TaxID=2978348 RepID=UPI003D36D7B8